AVKRKKKILMENNGPVLLDVVTYRTGGHSPSDAGAYRTKEEVEAWAEIDSIQKLKNDMIASNIASESEIESVNEYVESVILKAFKLASDLEISPRMDIKKEPDAISQLMFSNEKVAKMENRACSVLAPKEENPRVQKLKKKIRVGMVDGKPVSKVKGFSLRDALFESIIGKYYEDPTLIAFGEDCRDMGGAFGVYQHLFDSIPYHRLFNAPISEAAIVGAAVGYAMCGGRAIPELMYCDFLGRAGDEVFNQMAKWQSMSAGVLKMPVVLRVSVGSKYGAQHSQDWTSLCTHIPGLKVVFPVTPYDAKGLMNSALAGTDPVVFFESQRLYDIGEMFNPDGVPDEYYEIPIGEPDIKRQGNDITILTIGATLYNAIKAAAVLEEKYGVLAEVIDARSLVPFNYEKVLNSVKKTGKIILASDACDRGSYLNDITRNISEMAFDDLDGPVVVVGAKNWITPCFELEDTYFPQPNWIIDAIHEKIMPLKDHEPENNFTLNEQIRINKFGV
ncbi:MAG: thiamine pyrophosphate-dependent enzyme, partial [Clostridia bacterium]|nr:thiamine pyrophosphate-dependent enzyme [Clostridia bacterium]